METTDYRVGGKDMSIDKVRDYMKKFGRENDIIEFEKSSATVELAAEAAGVIPARIAKTLSFKGLEGAIIIVMAGDAKVDNKRYKKEFGLKAKMLTADEAVEYTGHIVGGVCPFAIERDDVDVYLDDSMKRFDTVFPAAGSSNSAIELNCDELEELSSNFVKWVDVCKGWREDESNN